MSDSKQLVVAADRLQRKVQDLYKAFQGASPHALIPPTAAFLLAEARDEAFELQKEIAGFLQNSSPASTA
jgi:hypothetical protein